MLHTNQHGSSMLAAAPDVLIRNCGSIWVLCPLTERAKTWFDLNVQSEPWQWSGATIVVEHRFALALLHGISDAGLVVK